MARAALWAPALSIQEFPMPPAPPKTNPAVAGSSSVAESSGEALHDETAPPFVWRASCTDSIVDSVILAATPTM